MCTDFPITRNRQQIFQSIRKQHVSPQNYSASSNERLTTCDINLWSRCNVNWSTSCISEYDTRSRLGSKSSRLLMRYRNDLRSWQQQQITASINRWRSEYHAIPPSSSICSALCIVSFSALDSLSRILALYAYVYPSIKFITDENVHCQNYDQVKIR